MDARSAPDLTVIQVPGVDRLSEGEARKVLFPRAGEEGTGELLLCRIAGRLYALDSVCPHEGGRLAEGPLEQGRLAVCPLHLYKFDPRDGRALDVECARARTYVVREVAGVAEIVVGRSGGGAR
jgi:nitrite reductase/ring-hydroxylating ferredoxin subunit